MIRISIGRNIQTIVLITLICLSILIIVLSIVPIYSGKLFDDNDNVGPDMIIANTTGKGYYNEGEQILISIASEEIGRTLQLKIAILSSTENLTIYFLTSTNYTTWNTSMENVSVLSTYAFGLAQILNGPKNYVEAIPSIIGYAKIPVSFYIVITNASTLSGDYTIADVDITFYHTWVRNIDFIWGIIFIIAAALVVFLPFYIKRKYNQRKVRKATKSAEIIPEDITLQEVTHEDIKPERVREVDLNLNKKICEHCGSKVDISVESCTTCGNKF